MPAISKFLFEEEFTGAVGEDGQPAPVVVRRKPKHFSEAEVDIFKKNAFEEGKLAGYEQGKAEALSDAASLTAQALAAIGATLPEAVEAAHRAREEAAAGAVTAMGAIARKLLPAMADQRAIEEIEALARDCLSRLAEEPRIVVKVAPDLAEAVRAKLETLGTQYGFAGRLVVMPDPGLPITDTRIEWADGGAERNVADIWKEIEDAIERYLAMKPGAGAS
jgi:flagellar assembly protein FliH